MNTTVFTPDVVAAITRHMNDDHGDDALLIVRALGGRPDATAAITSHVDGQGIEFTVNGTDMVWVSWGQPLTERAQVRLAVVQLYQRACLELGVRPRAKHPTTAHPHDAAPGAGGPEDVTAPVGLDPQRGDPAAPSDRHAPVRNLVRARASTNPAAETFVYWSGEVYAWQPGAGPHHLFGFEGFNVARAIEVDSGWQLLTREAAAYLDPSARTILDLWDNPFTGQQVQVQHVHHDPANIVLRTPRVPMLRVGEQVVFTTDVLLTYPSPLPVADYPEHSAEDTYRAMELFQLFCNGADLDSDAPSIPAGLSWTRVSPWLPWMAMGARPGGLVYHCSALKLGSAQELPAWLRQHAGSDFLHAPTTAQGPNQTSWTRFKADQQSDRSHA